MMKLKFDLGSDYLDLSIKDYTIKYKLGIPKSEQK